MTQPAVQLISLARIDHVAADQIGLGALLETRGDIGVDDGIGHRNIGSMRRRGRLASRPAPRRRTTHRRHVEPSPLTGVHQYDITFTRSHGWPTPPSAGGSPMNAPNDNTAAKGLRGWWHLPRDPACTA